MVATMTNSNNKFILGLISAFSVFLIIKHLHDKSQTNSEKKSDNINEPETKKILPTKSIVIGDSQSFFISKNNSVAKIIGTAQTEKNLWKSGIDLNWLKKAIQKYPISKNINNIIISIGTNSGYNLRDDVVGLYYSLRKKFPNAKLFVVKGSWGWGNLTSITENEVNKYYQKFKDLGLFVLPTAVGRTNNPHRNLFVYKKIGEEIEKQILK